jgi:hypothetical protein
MRHGGLLFDIYVQPVTKTGILYVGDILTLAILTLIGFAAHGEKDLSFLPRMGAVFVPMILSWFLVSPWLRLFQPDITSNLNQLWRVPVSMLFVVPLAALVRSLILNMPIIPIFVLVLSATFALGMTIWRGIHLFLNRQVR